MNKKLGLAVAGALVAFSSAANAGITIPAGDWTLDVGGVVNAYYTNTSVSGTAPSTGYGQFTAGQNGGLVTGATKSNQNNITTGLLPNYLSVSGKSRQNDLDIGFTISINPGASTVAAGKQSSQQESRQAFLTIGDASWGSIKLGKDLGIFASDAILNDMTLLGVGAGAGGLAGNTTTLGRIGTGFVYADWKSQVAYTSPNWNGFQFTAGVTQAFDAIDVLQGATSTGRGGSEPAFEGKASYSFSADALTGKVWVSGISQKVQGLTNASAAGINTAGTAFVAAVANTVTNANDRVTAGDIGINLNASGFGLTGYYYAGSGIGQTVQLNGGFDNTGHARDSSGGYVQGTYTIPGVGTKLGLSWGESITAKNGASDTLAGDVKDSMWTAGVYHPLTKSVNLVAEYSNVESKVGSTSGRANTISLGSILFF